jgi:methionyl-tRNA synthetase
VKYITTPIYYPNAAPHIGHAYTTVVGDALARYYRLQGEEVLYLTGTDEHGLKIARAAEERGVEPQDFVDELARAYIDTWRLLDISNDDFIRTTEERHKQSARALLERLYESGDIYKGRYEGPYCVACEAYYKEEELARDRLCPIHGTPVEHYAEDNYFFRLSRYGDPLLDHLRANPEFVFPEARRNEVVGFIDQGLADFSISRAHLAWGIPLPWDPDQVTYVWVEALMNYVSAAGFGRDDERFSRTWPAVHLVGKDILRFHAVYWPALLLAAGVPLPAQIAAHGWLMVGDEKMSKTRANQIHPADLVRTFGSDGYRYHFLRDVSFGPDGNFSWEGMVERYNADLANDFGNLANRALSLAVRYRGGEVRATSAVDGPEAALRSAAERARTGLAGFESYRFNEALATVWRFFGAANAYIEATEPWKLAKDPAQSSRLDEVLNATLESLRVGAILTTPVLPRAAAELWHRLGLSGRPDAPPYGETARFGTFPSSRVEQGEPLFPRIEE